jgi:hypothetical protein
MAPPAPGLAGSPSPRPPWRWWVAVSGIVAVYTSLYAVLIWQHTALPYFDQAGYVNKVDTIAERMDGERWAWIRPATYLAAEPTVRPPLMMVLPAWLGRTATPRVLAEYWLVMRVVGLALAAWTLAGMINGARIVPALLLTTLASWIYLSLNPLLYMMDAIFASFALLTFVLVGLDMQRLTARSAMLCAGSALALALIKPAGLALEFPMFCVLAIRNGVWIVHQHRTGRRWIAPTLARVAIYGLFLLVLYYLFQSPYGAGVRWLYAWASLGYWDTPRHLLTGIAYLVPGWLVLAAAAWPLWQAHRARVEAADATPPVTHPEDQSAAVWMVVCGVAAIAWWLVFSVLLTYAFDPRVTAGAMPIAVATVLVLVRTSRYFVAVITAVSAVVFSLSVGSAAMLLAFHPLNFEGTSTSATERWLSSGRTWFGVLPNPQRPVREVGLIPLMRDVQSVILAAKPSGETLVCVILDEFVEAVSLDLALRALNAGAPRRLGIETAPWASQGFNIDHLLVKRKWFLTKAPRHSVALQGDALAIVHALDALLTKPTSPLRGALTSPLERTISQPLHGHDVTRTLDGNPLVEQRLTLWHLPRALTPQELLAALDFIAPMLEPTSLAGQWRAERARIKGWQDQGIGVITPAAAARFGEKADPAFRDVRFAGGLTLLSVGHHRGPDGGFALDLVWRAEEDLDLPGTVAVHLTDASHTKMLGQADYRRDTIPTPVKRGTIWRDSVIVPPQAAKGAVILGLGILDRPNHMLGVSHPASDWEDNGVRHRLLVPLSPEIAPRP